MRSPIQKRLADCQTCIAHRRHVVHTPMGEMPIATFPMQIISTDLTHQYVLSNHDNGYALTIIGHCTSWAEGIPLKGKTNKLVWDAFTRIFPTPWLSRNPYF